MALPQGTCTGKIAIGSEELEERSYTLNEATELRALTYAGATMIQGGHVTIHEDVKDKERIYREDFKSRFESEATGGRKKDECGGFVGSGEYFMPTDKYIRTQYLTLEVRQCYKKLIGSWKQNRLNRGAGNSEENTSLNDFILSRIIRNAYIQTDKMIWFGDYKCSEHELAHYDGFVKRIVQATNTSITHVERWVFAGLVATDFIEGFAGGRNIKVPFTTNLATTLAALATLLSTQILDPFTGNPIYTVALIGGNTIVVTANRVGTPNDVKLGVTDGTGVDRCYSPKQRGTGTSTYTEIAENKKGDTPILIPYTTITQNNVLGELEKMYSEVSLKNPDLLENPNAKLHVSRHVANMITLATRNVSNQIKGVQSIIENSMIVSQPYLKGSVMVFGAKENMHFATDLISDMDTIEQWVEKSDQEVRFRAEVMQGTQIDNFTEIFANLGNSPFQFQPAQID